MKNVKWSRPRLLSDANFPLRISDKSGVYRIRAFKEDGKSLPIPRLGGTDELGILHIGRSKNLERRIKEFYRACEGSKAPHKAGREFCDYRFKKLIPTKILRFDYIVTPTEEAALEKEHLEHKEYRNWFLDRPPLDGTSGQSTSKHSKR